MYELTTRINDLEKEVTNLKKLARIIEDDFILNTVNVRSVKVSTFGTTYRITGVSQDDGTEKTIECFVEHS